MTTTARDSRTIFVAAYRGARRLVPLNVIEDRPKALYVADDDGRACWLPKSGLRPRRRGLRQFADEFVLADWFVPKLSRQQQLVLGLIR